MWIVTNKSFLSVVEEKSDKTKFVVRARIKGDIEAFFEDPSMKVIETNNSDYRFRVFVDKSFFKMKIMKEINSIDYDNFKDSVKSAERKTWYTRIWSVMFDVQESLYGAQKWWEQYYNDKNFRSVYQRKQD
jgi:hypothetical protein